MPQDGPIRMVTKYEQIENLIRERIRKGELKPGDRIESEYELARRLGVHRFTANKAIGNLVRAGILYRVQGKGTFVAEIRPGSETPTVGLLYGGPSEALFASDFFGPILQGIHDAEAVHLLVMGRQYGWPSTQHGPTISEEELARVDGFFALEIFNDEYLARIAERKPVVLIDYYSERLGLPGVVMDNRGAGAEATRHLLSLGHRRIACLCEAPEREHTDPAWQERRLGWLEAMKEAGIRHPERFFVPLRRRSSEVGIEAAERVLAMKPRPTAAFVVSASVAVTFGEALRARGLSLPSQMSITTFGETRTCEQAEPPLTAATAEFRQMGKEAVSLMEEMLSGRTPRQPLRVVPTELVVRGSTAKPS